MSGADESRTEAPADAAVVARVLAGDVEAFATIVRRYQRQVLALGIRFLRVREEAEDFAQEVFLQAFRRLGSWRGTGRFYSWLIRIAYTHGSRRARQRYAVDALGEAAAVDPAPTPEEQAQREEARQAVLRAMRRLPRRYADCIGLYFFFGLSYQEVSEVTQYPLNTVRSHIRRARHALARELAPYAAANPEGSHDVP